MTTLTFVDVTDDGHTLSMRDETGNLYTLPLDTAVLQAIAGVRRRGSSPAPQPAVVVEGPVTPADVQRLLRHGAEVETLAAESGMDVETIRSFAVPVLQERAFVAEQAGKCAVPSGGTLVEAVTARLATRGITEGISWDSWRRSNGMWTVLVRFPDEAGTLTLAEEVGTWLYDPKTRSVTAEDGTARWLTNLPTTPEPDPERVVVIEDVDIRDKPAQPERESRRRSRRLKPVRDSEHVAGQLSLSEPETDAELVSVQVTASPEPSASTPAAPHPQSVQPAGKPLSRRAARRQAARRRAENAEPTWDEILFGVSRSDDPTV